jgi:CRISPR-associated endonuclease/helicase Cas3
VGINTARRQTTNNKIDIKAFRNDYASLTEHVPFRWQERLFRGFLEGDLPSAIDLPTGLGKTAVMALWLIARAWGAPVPRRLVYVVDRRAVVDQATTFAVTLRENLDSKAAHLKRSLELGDRSLSISTLRGQYVDNREWLDDPAAAAIIVGTIDMIGSRLLFEGYGVSRKMRPYHAGLLGTDGVIVLDEAHLAPSFERLVQSVSDPKRFGACSLEHRRLIPTLKLISLSATCRAADGDVFRLKGVLKSPPGRRHDLDDEIVIRRIKARKRITLVSVKADKLAEELASRAWRLSARGRLPIRCIVFSRSREIAETARTHLDELAGREGKLIATELLVGARRVREREDVARWLEENGFIAGRSVDKKVPAFLFATSAGEVGVDLDADHMVCDLAPWERMVQRLGRTNRRGEGDAQIIVLVNHQASQENEGLSLAPLNAKQGPRSRYSTQKTTADRVQIFKKPFAFLKRLSDGSLDGSPEALRTLKDRAASNLEIAAAIKAATTSPPLRPDLTRPLVDAWSMTSLTEHMGRPEVAPWLRGWVDETPQTTVVWRTYLPVRQNGDKVTDPEVEEYFEAAPPHLSEQLESDTFHVEKWLRDRCESLLKRQDAENPHIVGFVLSRSGELLATLTLDDFAMREDKARARRLEEKLQEMVDAQLIVDARVKGLSRGLLDSNCSKDVDTADACADWLPATRKRAASSERSRPTINFRVRETTNPDDTGGDPQWQQRHRFALDRNDEGIDIRWLLVEKSRGDSATETDRSASRNYQLLVDHHERTEAKMRDLARRLSLPRALTHALALAARLHDEGKRADRWQRAFRAPRGSEPYAKTTGPIDLSVLASYRHEFGSLRYVEENTVFEGLPQDLQQLVLHLVASHHGQARPVIGTLGCEDAPPSVLEERARKVALRFAWLQERWGPWGLAWLETLLRAADQQASKENDERPARAV